MAAPRFRGVFSCAPLAYRLHTVFERGHNTLMKISGIISYVAVAVGALLWLLIGLFDLNLVNEICGYGSHIARYIYVGIGLGGMFFVYVSIAFSPLKNL